jgi:protein-tyrosine-phosphatase
MWRMANMPGHPPHKGTQKILKENAVTFEGIKARQVEKEDLTTDGQHANLQFLQNQ